MPMQLQIYRSLSLKTLAAITHHLFKFKLRDKTKKTKQSNN